MEMHGRKLIELDQGWSFLQKGTTKLKNLLEGKPGEAQFNTEEYIMFYTYVPLMFLTFACI
jgi:cullin 1